MRVVLFLAWVAAVASTLIGMRYVDSASESRAPKIATLERISGTVQVRPGDSLLWSDGLVRQDLKEGDSVVVGAKGKATIRFIDGRSVNLSAGSQVALSMVTGKEDVVSGFTLRVIAGEVTANAVKLPPRRTSSQPAPVLKIIADRREIALPKASDAVRINLPEQEEPLTVAPLAGIPQLKDLEAIKEPPRPLERKLVLPKKPELKTPSLASKLATGLAMLPTSTRLAAVDFNPTAPSLGGATRSAPPAFDLEGKVTRLPLSGVEAPAPEVAVPEAIEPDLVESLRPKRDHRKIAVVTPNEPPQLAAALPHAAYFTLRPFSNSAAFPPLNVPLSVTADNGEPVSRWQTVLAIADDAGHRFHSAGSPLTPGGGAAEIPVGRLAKVGFIAEKGIFSRLRLKLEPFAVLNGASGIKPNAAAKAPMAKSLTLRFLGGQGSSPLRVDLSRLERVPLAGEWAPDPGPAQQSRFSVYLAHGNDLGDLGPWLQGSNGFSAASDRIDERTTWHFVKAGRIIASLVGTTTKSKVRALGRDLQADLVYAGSTTQLIPRQESPEAQAKAIGELLKTREVIYAQFRDEVRPISSKFAAEHPEVIRYVLSEKFAVFGTPVKSLTQGGGDAKTP